MMWMLIVGYCYGLRSERKLALEVELHLAYRWFCRLDLDDKVPHHSTFSENRLHRFRESDVLRHIFERVVAACMAAGLVKGEGFAVDASVMEANASRYHGKAPDEIEWAEPERQTRAVKEYLAALEAETAPNPDRKPPKVVSPSDPCSAWTAKANKRVQFGYGLNYLIDIENAVIVDVEATPARLHRAHTAPGLKHSGGLGSLALRQCPASVLLVEHLDVAQMGRGVARPPDAVRVGRIDFNPSRVRLHDRQRVFRPHVRRGIEAGDLV
jgi:IS5 family transposase